MPCRHSNFVKLFPAELPEGVAQRLTLADFDLERLTRCTYCRDVWCGGTLVSSYNVGTLRDDWLV